MNIAVILAGGVGSRVGADVPKQFIEVLGRPVIVYTLEAFESHPEIDAIEVVCLEERIDYLRELAVKFGITKLKYITPGGEDFQHSVLNGVKALAGIALPQDIILVHYAASPLVTADIISDCIRVAREHGNSLSATPCYLLLGSNDDDRKSTQWVDRDKIMQLNSPQCFTYEYVRDLYREAIARDLLTKVEPHTTSLMYLMGRTIYFAKGSQQNIKITTKEDLDTLAAHVLLRRYRQNQTADQ